MMKYVYILAALLLIGAALEWHGYGRGYDGGVAATQEAADKRVAQAQERERQATAERDATNQTLAAVRLALRENMRQLQIANFYADAAIAERAGLQQKLTAATAALKTALRKAAHDSPDCTDLARLPVCPVVAERLWGMSPHPAAAGSSGGGSGAGVPRP